MRYLKKTHSLGLQYQMFFVVLKCFNDVDWNSFSNDSKTTTGYIFNMAARVVSWKYKKQTIFGLVDDGFKNDRTNNY